MSKKSQILRNRVRKDTGLIILVDLPLRHISIRKDGRAAGCDIVKSHKVLLNFFIKAL
jgi:hypothetical protein